MLYKSYFKKFAFYLALKILTEAAVWFKKKRSHFNKMTKIHPALHQFAAASRQQVDKVPACQQICPFTASAAAKEECPRCPPCVCWAGSSCELRWLPRSGTACHLWNTSIGQIWLDFNAALQKMSRVKHSCGFLKEPKITRLQLWGWSLLPLLYGQMAWGWCVETAHLIPQYIKSSLQAM